jgi:hypothetical protein
MGLATDGTYTNYLCHGINAECEQSEISNVVLNQIKLNGWGVISRNFKCSWWRGMA